MGSIGVPLSFPGLATRHTGREVENQSQQLRRFAPIAMLATEVVSDATATVLAVQLGWVISSVAHSQAAAYSQPGALLTVMIAVSVLSLLERMGAYRPAKSLLFVKETATVLATAFTVSMALVALSVAGKIAMPLGELPVISATLFLCLMIEKTSLHLLQQRLHEKGVASTNVALCGKGLACRRLYSTLLNSPKLGLWPSVVVDPSGSADPVVESGYKSLRSAEVLTQQLDCATLRSAGVEKVLIIATSLSALELQQTLDEAARFGMPTEICAGDVASFDAPIEHADIDGIVMWRTRNAAVLDLYKLGKRCFDAVASAILIVLFGPVMLAVAAAIKITSPGEALFRQERVGKGGKMFTILKFRSMHKHACGDGFSPTSGTDARISRVGRLLRKTSLDELPQLINVLRGEMSLVGPRPEMPFIADKYTALESRRLEAVPGITGLWQISAHRKELIHNNMQYDLYYVRHRGFFMDVAILIHTLGFAIKGV
jgi:exopolysaccharide biosynthesis polyprenyl glycosylphosphotransferase